MGIDQRDYFNDNKGYDKRMAFFEFSNLFKNWDVLKTIIAINLFIFLLNSLGVGKYEVLGKIFYVGSVSWDELMRGKVWLLITYAFLHGGPFHVFFNMLVVWFSGSMILSRIGRNNFLYLYFLSAIVAALVHLFYIKGLQFFGFPIDDIVLIGASGAAFALMLGVCLFFYNQKITVLLFFIIPLRVTGRNLIKWILIISIVFEVVSLLLRLAGKDLLLVSGIAHIAHMAHIGGGVFGLFFIKNYLRKEFYSTSGKPNMMEDIFGFLKSNFNKPKEKNSVNSQNKSDPKIKVTKNMIDEILDKINKKGFSSLSNEEKKILDNGKDFL